MKKGDKSENIRRDIGPSEATKVWRSKVVCVMVARAFENLGSTDTGRRVKCIPIIRVCRSHCVQKRMADESSQRQAEWRAEAEQETPSAPQILAINKSVMGPPIALRNDRTTKSHAGAVKHRREVARDTRAQKREPR